MRGNLFRNQMAAGGCAPLAAEADLAPPSKPVRHEMKIRL